MKAARLRKRGTDAPDEPTAITMLWPQPYVEADSRPVFGWPGKDPDGIEPTPALPSPDLEGRQAPRGGPPPAPKAFESERERERLTSI